MFGLDDHNDDKKVEDQTAVTTPTVTEPALGDESAPDENTSTTSVSSSDDQVGAPALDDHATNDYILTDAAPVDASAPAPVATVSTSDTDDLLQLKQEALQKLSPLLGHLDQTPEEKFRTTMMMIQAADDQSLVRDAYEAAQAITDEKAKAQALLDIVNEINYFTQQHTD